MKKLYKIEQEKDQIKKWLTTDSRIKLAYSEVRDFSNIKNRYRLNNITLTYSEKKNELFAELLIETSDEQSLENICKSIERAFFKK